MNKETKQLIKAEMSKQMNREPKDAELDNSLYDPQFFCRMLLKRVIALEEKIKQNG